MYACGMQVLGRRDQAFFRTPYIIVQAHGNILDTVSACMFDIPGVVYACLHDIKLNSSWCIYTYKWQ